jgi:hypothetical protein
VAGSCEYGNKLSGSINKIQGVSRLAMDLLASEERLCCMELLT